MGDEGRERRRHSRQGAMTAGEADRSLRDKIQEFAYQRRFRRDFEQAMARFFGEEVAQSRTLVADEVDIPAFQEWFFFDYVTRSGERIIDIFARREGPKLREKEREFLDLWREWNRYRLFEVQDVMPGTGIVVKDLLSDEILEVHDRSASRSAQRWQIFLARPIYTDRLHFTGAGALLPPMKKREILEWTCSHESGHMWEEIPPHI